MKVLFGSPGRLSGLVLRMGQCSFAASSIGIMVSASGFSASTAFWASIGPSYIGKGPLEEQKSVCVCERERDKETERQRKREMNMLFGSPGSMSGFVLRLGQCLFAASSIGMMVFAFEVPINRTFCYLIASMGLQILWSFALACVDMQALRLRRNLQHPILLSLFFVGDWVTSLLSLAAASSSAGVVLLYAKDSNYCSSIIHPPCTKFQVSVALAFISWFLLAISSYVMFWLLCSV